MKVAIIGAGISGLAAGITLEKGGILPIIYEQEYMSGRHHLHLALVFSMPLRHLTDNPVKHLNKLVSLDLKPHSMMKKLVLHSRNATAQAEGELGSTFIAGIEPNSIQQQLSQNLKTKTITEQRVDIKKIMQENDYVIIGSGCRPEDMLAHKYLKGWKQQTLVYSRLLTLNGSFDANTMEVWLNKELISDGTAIILPYSAHSAIFMLCIPNLNSWEEFDQKWKNFIKTKKVLEQYHPLGMMQRIHICADAKTRVWENCLFVGDGAGLVDSLLGLGLFSAVSSGFLAAKAILENKNYDELLKPITGLTREMNRYRILFNQMTDENLDTMVTTENNPIISKLLYNTEIDWFKIAALAAKPLASLVNTQSTPEFRRCYGFPADI